MIVERSISLDARPEEVWKVIMDPRRLEDWVSIHRELKEAPPGRLRKGSELAQSLKVAGQTFDVRWKVTEAERPRRVTWDGRGPLGTRARVVYELAAEEDGTRFDYLNEYELPGGALGAVAGRAVAGKAGRESERSLALLADLLAGDTASE